MIRRWPIATTRPLPPTPTAMVAAALSACAIFMVVLALRRAGWLDEYWTVWQTDPALGFRAAYQYRWRHDTQHPPTFYALAWAVAHAAGQTLAARRLAVNGLAILLIVPTILACRRDPAKPAWPAIFTLLIVGDPYFITYFAEHRSYFLGLAGAACVTAVLRRLSVQAALGHPLGRARVWWFVLLTLFVLMLHYTLSLCLLGLLGGVCLWQWRLGHRRLAMLVAVVGVVALLPLLAMLAAALVLHHPTPVLKQGLARGCLIVAGMAGVGAAANPVFCWAALQGWRAQRRGASTATGSMVPVLAIVLALEAGGFLLLHLVTRTMYPRLLLGLIPIAAAALAELAAAVAIPPRLFGLAALITVAVAGATSLEELHNPRWEREAPTIRTTVRACSTTQVAAVNPLHLLAANDPIGQMTGQNEAVALSYHMIARKWGFAVKVVPEDGPLPPPDPHCPTLVWLEHNFWRPGLTGAELYALVRPQHGLPTGSHLHHDGSHALLTVPAPR